MIMLISFTMSDCSCHQVVCISANAYTQVYEFCGTFIFTIFLLHSNLHGKRPADYAVSVEMLEIFQEASDGTKYANTSLSPSASLSVVRLHGNASFFFLISPKGVNPRLLILDISKL